MANKIVVGTNYFTSFVNGQGVPPVSNYFSAAADLDTTLTTIKDTINTMIDELNGIQGPNAVFAQDILFIDQTPSSTTTTGRIGEKGAVVTVGTPNTGLDIAAGTVSLLGVRTPVSAQTKDGSALPNGTVFCGMDVNGNVVLSAAAGGQLFDIAEATKAGGIFTTIVDKLETFIDGDEWLAMRTEPANSPLVAGAQRTASRRLDGLSRLLGGFTTATNGDALGARIIGGGTAGSPRIGLGDGAGVIDASSGWYRSAPNVLSYVTGGIQRFQLNPNGLKASDGTLALPGIRFLSDTASGLYRPAANALGFSSNNLRVGEFDPNGNLDLPQNARVKGQRTLAQTFADATVTNVKFTAVDVFDIGNRTTDVWHNHSGGSPGDEEFTVPTGGNGTYLMILAVDWASPVTNARELFHEITVNNTQIQKAERSVATGEEYSTVISVHDDLIAGDVVRARITQTDSVGALGLDLQGATLSIVKVA